MSDPAKNAYELPPEQQAIRDKCFHSRGTFVEFLQEDIEKSIPERFERIVQTYPNRLAVKMGEYSLTYDELNRYANRIARSILEKCGPGSEPIGLLFEHGVDVLAAIYGTLKAGKFYAVLDPTFPVERLIYILDDSETSLLVTNSHHSGLIKELEAKERFQIVNVDEVKTTLSNNLGIRLSADDFADCRYTSGTTGKPKGVIETHRDLLHSIAFRSHDLAICIEDRLSLLHSTSFGSAKVNLYGATLNGASLFPFDAKSQGILALRRWLERERITLLHTSPNVFRQFANLDSETPADLRMICLSGSPTSARDFELFKSKVSPTTLLNLSLSATETNAISSCTVDRTFTYPENGVPVGYACTGKTVLLLDENGREVEPGSVGEIAVKSRYLTTGYWRQRELNRSKFLPTSDHEDERTYLTGDLGRMLPDGFLIHLGRKDLMVKIRGYRVNMGEVEGALVEHPHVNEAGVAAWERDAGEKYLVGYVVADPDSAPDVSDLREFLSNKLPDYMVPSAFIFLDSLPLTNGKLDRSALPKPDHTRPGLNVPYISPRTPNEQTLSKIWSELLSVDRVGVNDNFFDLGGHSLAGAAILARVKDAFGLELTVADLLAGPTVAHMSEAISRQQGDGGMAQPPQRSGDLATAPTSSLREPSDSFNNFPKEEVEQSIPERFEKIVGLYPDRLDRRALPAPGNGRPDLDVAFIAPASPIEKRLACLWCDLLSLDQVGIHDDFFDLGGHSLSGTRLVSLIHEEFQFDLPVSEFFAAPTIAQLAQRIDGVAKEKQPGPGKKTWTYLCELQRGKDRKPIFVFPGGGGGEPEFFVYGFLARHVGTEYPFYGLRARGADGLLKPHGSVAQMADGYVEEIRALQPEGPYFFVGECAGGVTAYEAARQLQVQGQKVAMLVLMDVERPTLIKYLRFRAGRLQPPVSQFWNETVCGSWRKNYYLARLPHHLRQLRSLTLRDYPSYVAGRIISTLKPPEKEPRPMNSRRERAEIVLYTTASGDALRHIEWVRENYRRTVRRFCPGSYKGDIEIIVSEKLCHRDPTLGWKKLALKGLGIHPVPGDHWSYIRDHVAVAGPILRECLEKAEKSTVCEES